MYTINEDYKDYEPPTKARQIVERLLATLPAGYLVGVQAVVLTNSRRLGKGKTNRIKGRKYAESACLGFYHPASPRGGAWIQLVVDNISEAMPAFFWRSKFLSDMIFAGTVYHEVGHHLDATIGSSSKTGEAAADEWSTRLRAQHFARRYPVISRLLRFLISRYGERIRKYAGEGVSAARKKAKAF